MQCVRQYCRTDFRSSTTGARETGQGLLATEKFANVHDVFPPIKESSLDTVL
jgi:hypothetical protein